MDQVQQHLDENHTQIDNNQNCNNETSQVTGIDLLSKIQNLENELAEALEANDMYKTQLKSLLSKEVSFHLDVPEKSTDRVGKLFSEGRRFITPKCEGEGQSERIPIELESFKLIKMEGSLLFDNAPYFFFTGVVERHIE
ncbi:hypothetical protein CRYUN_Cryun09bG0079500 [Craigia yunnanensis]